ncbi:amino acid permease [Candidatus Woesearchaeota archaeon]|nr:amino acid permease [Candidatus Woesearchaeota archaeon]
MKHTSKHHRSHHSKNLTLKRNLGLFQATSAGVGIIVGAGIYALIGVAAGLAGNMVWLSFLIASVVAAFTGLSYAELSSLFPKSDGEYSYVHKAFSWRALAFVTGYLVILSGVVGAAAVSMGFAGYLSQYLGIPLLYLAVGAIIIFSIINYMGIEQSSRVNIVCTVLEVGALILVIIFALRYIGSVDYFSTPSLTGVFSAASLIFFAYTGFESIVKLSEETKNARRNIPLALILSIAITTVIYMLVGITAISVIGWETLASSSAPLALVATALLNSFAGVLLSIVALFSTGNTILILLVTTSRMLYGLGKDLRSLKFLSVLHKSRRTPVNAILLTAIISMAFVFFGKKIDFIANISNVVLFITFFLVNISVILLRYNRYSRAKRRFTVPLNIGMFPVLPALGALFCVFMIINIDFLTTVIGFFLTIAGFGFYWLVKK